MDSSLQENFLQERRDRRLLVCKHPKGISAHVEENLQEEIRHLPMINTAFTRRLAIRTPIAQAPIGSASTAELAAAVSEAGGLGLIALSWRNDEELRAIVHRTRERTAKPFGANVVLAWNQVRRIELALDLGVRVISTSWGKLSHPIARLVHVAGGLLVHQVASAAEARVAVDAGADVIVAQGWEAGGHVQSEA